MTLTLLKSSPPQPPPLSRERGAAICSSSTSCQRADGQFEREPFDEDSSATITFSLESDADDDSFSGDEETARPSSRSRRRRWSRRKVVLEVARLK